MTIYTFHANVMLWLGRPRDERDHAVYSEAVQIALTSTPEGANALTWLNDYVGRLWDSSRKPMPTPMIFMPITFRFQPGDVVDGVAPIGAPA